MTYLIALVSDRIKAEEAYTQLEKAGIPQADIVLLGKGYKTLTDIGLMDTKQEAKKSALLMSIWLIPFGFCAGYGFNLITGLHTFDWAGTPGNHIIGGICGAIGGCMGSIFVGGGVVLTGSDNNPLPYSNRLQEGKYLILIKGTETLRKQAETILKNQEIEALQSYIPTF